MRMYVCQKDYIGLQEKIGLPLFLVFSIKKQHKRWKVAFHKNLKVVFVFFIDVFPLKPQETVAFYVLFSFIYMFIIVSANFKTFL